MTTFTNFDDIITSGKKYKIIYADPPWHFNDRADSRGVENKYSTMLTKDICNLQVNNIADDDSILFMWGVFPMMQEALDVISSWGFTYKTLGFIWVKKNPTGRLFMGMGNWTRSNAEYCLIGTKGKPKRLDAGISSVVISDIQEHSEKPDEVRKRIIRLVGDLPRIELFARTKIHGWDTFGNDHKLQLEPLEVFHEI